MIIEMKMIYKLPTKINGVDIENYETNYNIDYYIKYMDGSEAKTSAYNIHNTHPIKDSMMILTPKKLGYVGTLVYILKNEKWRMR